MYPNFGYIESSKRMSKKGFTMVPNALILDSELSNDAKALFCYLRSLSDKYRNLRNRTLLAKLGISINTLQNCKTELVKRGYLTIHRKSSSNYYNLRLPKFRVGTLSDSTQSTYVKSGYHYKSNTSNSNTIISKRKTKGFKKFND